MAISMSAWSGNAFLPDSPSKAKSKATGLVFLKKAVLVYCPFAFSYPELLGVVPTYL
jgi:hypothetical protein